MMLEIETLFKSDIREIDLRGPCDIIIILPV